LMKKINPINALQMHSVDFGVCFIYFISMQELRAWFIINGHQDTARQYGSLRQLT